MSAGFHVWVVLLALSFAVGCSNGGAGMARAPRAPVQVDHATSRDEAAATSDRPQPPSGKRVAGGVDRPAAAEIVPSRPGAREIDAAVARALASQNSAVEWPRADAFRLSEEQPAGAERAPEDRTPVPAAALEAVATSERGGESHRSRPAATAMSAMPANAAGQRAMPKRGVAGGRFVSPEPAIPSSWSSSATGQALEQRAPFGNPEDLASALTRRLRDDPGALAAHLDYQLMRLLSDEPVPDHDALSGLPAEDRELLTTLLEGLSNFRNGVRSDTNMLLSQKIRPLLELSGRLRSGAALSIPTISLCRKVSAFGRYEPMAGRFAAGTLSYALAYCELDNVSSRQNERGEWESRLTQQAVLYTDAGRQVWSNPRQRMTDRSRNRRQEFFVAQVITLLPNLSTGRYLLKVTVQDEQVKRVAEAAIPIEIVAHLAPAARQRPTPRAEPTAQRE